MYFAIVDRGKVPSLVNACFSVHSLDGEYRSGPVGILLRWIQRPAPWRDGAVYLLPAVGFERQDDLIRSDQRIRTSVSSPNPIRPVARVPVRAIDFPMLGDIGGMTGQWFRRAQRRTLTGSHGSRLTRVVGPWPDPSAESGEAGSLGVKHAAGYTP